MAVNVSLETLIDWLNTLNVRFQIVSNGEGCAQLLEFKSLRNTDSFGIYYIEGSIDRDLNALDGSLFLAQKPLNIKNGLFVLVDYPQIVFYRLLQLAQENTSKVKGIHPSAIVDPKSVIHPDAYIGPFCVIGASVIEANVHLHSHVVVFDNVILEEGVVVESHSTLGATGVAWVRDPQTGEKIVQPQIGGVRIGRGSFLGSDVTVVRGSVNEITEIGSQCSIAHGTKIGHGCRLGDEVHCANNVSIAGNVDLASNCFLGAGCVIRPRVSLAKGIVVGAGAVVVKDEIELDVVLAGVPAKAQRSNKNRLSGVPINQ